MASPYFTLDESPIITKKDLDTTVVPKGTPMFNFEEIETPKPPVVSSPAGQSILQDYESIPSPSVVETAKIDGITEEDKDWSEDDLKKDKGWIKNARTIYKFQNGGKDFVGSDKEAATWLLNRHTRLGNNFTNLGLTTAQVDRMDEYEKDTGENVKQAWVDSIDKYENSDWTLRGFFKGAFWSVVDLPTVLTLGTAALAKAVGGKAAGAIAKHSFKEMLKKRIKQEMREKGGEKLSKERIKQLSKKTRSQVARTQMYSGSALGGAYTGAYDLMLQNFKGDIDPEYEYNPISTAIAVPLGMTIGGLAPQVFTRAGEKFFRNKRVDDLFKEQDHYNSELKFADVFDHKDTADLAAKQEIGDRDGHNVFGIFSNIKRNEKKGPLKVLSWGSGKKRKTAKKTDKGNEFDDGGIPIPDKKKKGKFERVPYNAIPEVKLLNKIAPEDTETKAHDLKPIKDENPNDYIKSSELEKGDTDIVFSANIVGQLKQDQADVEINRMADTVNQGGDLIIKIGPQKKKYIGERRKAAEGITEEREAIEKKPGKPPEEIITKEDPTGREADYKPIGVGKKQVKEILEKRFEDVEQVRYDKDTDSYVPDLSSDIFIARKKYSLHAELLPDDSLNLSDKDFSLKEFFKVGANNIKSKLKLVATQNAGLPTDIAQAQRVANRLTEQIKGPINRKVKAFNEDVRQNLETTDGRKWNKMTPKERDYANLVMTHIFRGRDNYISPANRLKNIQGADNTLRVSGEFDDLGSDPLKAIPDSVVQKIKTMREDITKIQGDAVKSGLIDKDSPLAINLVNRGKNGLIDLHVNRQYRIIDDVNWRKDLKKYYPDRIARAKAWFDKSGQLDDLTLATISNNVALYQKLKVPFNNLNKRNITEKETKKILDENGYDSVTQLQSDFLRSKEDSLDELVNSFLDKYSREELDFLRNATDLEGNFPSKTENQFFSANQSPSAQVRSTFYRRGQIPAPLRSLMGEYTDVENNYVQTYYKLAQNVENFKYEKIIQRALNNSIDPNTGQSTLFPNVKFIIKEDSTVAAPEGYTLLSDATRLPKFTKGINIPLREITPDPKDPAKVKEIYVPDVIADAIKTGNDIKPWNKDGWLSSVYRYYIGAQAYTRLAVTALRLSAYPRNFAGAAIKSMANGNFSAGAVNDAKKIFRILKGFDDPTFNTYYQKMVNLGLVGQSTRAAAIRDAFDEAADNPMRLWNMNSLTNTQGKIQKPLEFVKNFADKSQQYLLDRYQLMDDYWKIYTFITERNRYKQVLLDDPEILGKYKPGEEQLAAFNGKKVGDQINPDDIKRGFRADDGGAAKITYMDDYAAQMVAKHMDNYGEVARFLKIGRRLPVADFLSYKAEQVRTTWNMMGTALFDIRRGRQLQRKSNGKRGGAQYMAGLQRLGSMLGVFSMNATIPATMSYFMLRESDEKNGSPTVKIGGVEYKNPYTTEEARRNITRADFLKGASIIPLGKPDKNGSYTGLDYNRINPIAPLQENFSIIFQAFMEGEEALTTRLAKTKDAAMERIYEEIGPTMLLDTLRNLYLGRDQYGRPLTEPYETREGQKMLAYLEEAAKVFEPGISRDVRKLKKSLEETKGKTFFTYETKTEIEPITGRVIDQDVKEDRTPGGFLRTPKDQLYKALGSPKTIVEPLQSLPFKMSSHLKQIQKSSSIFLNEFKTNETLDEDTLVAAYKEALIREKEGYNNLSKSLLQAKRILSDKQITNGITAFKTIPSNYNKYYKKVQKFPKNYKVSSALQPNSVQVNNALRKMKNVRKGPITEWRAIQKKLQEVYKSINNSEYDYVQYLEPVNKKEKN
tara:strand:+ start:4318 stop:9729 length:5412 start_codon:yes stop_codon:yes gene_type:complete